MNGHSVFFGNALFLLDKKTLKWYYDNGDIMAEKTHVEQFYDFIDAVAMKLYETKKEPYLNGVKEALNLLMDDQTEEDIESDVINHFKALKYDIEGVDFNKEDVRKAIQLALLKGFKHLNVTNAMMTPDSIGMFIAYLLKKLYKKPFETLLDPMIGTGNLIATINNHFSDGFMTYGIDDEPLMAGLARNILDALEMDHQVFLQNTLTYQGPLVDCIITDFPVKAVDQKEEYVPYQVVLHHLEHLKDNQFFIALVENDFFDQHRSEKFKELLLEKAHLYGLIKLDESLFKNHPKSILILQKKQDINAKIDDFLLVDLPAFTDEEAFNLALGKIEQWFKKKEVD